MELDDIRKAQEELFKESREFFEDWYEKEEDFRREFTGEED